MQTKGKLPYSISKGEVISNGLDWHCSSFFPTGPGAPASRPSKKIRLTIQKGIFKVCKQKGNCHMSKTRYWITHRLCSWYVLLRRTYHNESHRNRLLRKHEFGKGNERLQNEYSQITGYQEPRLQGFRNKPYYAQYTRRVKGDRM